MNLKHLFFIVLLVLVTSCQNHYTPVKITGKEIPVTSDIKPDTAIQNFIKPYSEHINKTLDSVLAYNPTNLDKHAGKTEHRSGKFNGRYRVRTNQSCF